MIDNPPPILFTGYVSGLWYTDGLTVQPTAGTATADTLYVYPVRIFEPVTIQSVFFRITTGGAGGNAKAGIFAHDVVTKRPGSRLGQTAGVAVGTSAADWIAALSLSLSPGIVWLAIIADATIGSVNVATTNGPSPAMIGGTNGRSPMPVSAVGAVALGRAGGDISYANGIPATWAASGTPADVVATTPGCPAMSFRVA